MTDDPLARLLSAEVEPRPRAWTVNEELRFVERLGKWSGLRIPIRDLFRGYLAGLELRRHGLTDMDCVYVRDRVRTLMSKIPDA